MAVMSCWFFLSPHILNLCGNLNQDRLVSSPLDLQAPAAAFYYNVFTTKFIPGARRRFRVPSFSVNATAVFVSPCWVGIFSGSLHGFSVGSSACCVRLVGNSGLAWCEPVWFGGLLACPTVAQCVTIWCPVQGANPRHLWLVTSHVTLHVLPGIVALPL